jgi:hypothetical protein
VGGLEDLKVVGEKFPHPCACSPGRLDSKSHRRQHGVTHNHAARGTAPACARRRAAFSIGAGVHPTRPPRRALSPLLHKKHTPGTKTSPRKACHSARHNAER